MPFSSLPPLNWRQLLQLFFIFAVLILAVWLSFYVLIVLFALAIIGVAFVYIKRALISMGIIKGADSTDIHVHMHGSSIHPEEVSDADFEDLDKKK